MRILLAAIIVLFGLLQSAQARHHGYRHYARYVHESSHSASVAAFGLVPGLSAKASEIVSSCGSRIISAIRPGAVVAGTHHASLHRYGMAVDIAGSPGCIYSHLYGWAGGFSTDYNAVQHVHISLGGREDGARFVHGGGHHHRSHYASRRHHWG